MNQFEGRATTRVDAPAHAVFDLITDIDRLPTWNNAIERIVDRPGTLDAGTEWVVVMHPPRLPRWNSRSRVQEIDRDRLRFSYETQSDDGNPSFARWTWQVVTDGEGAAVEVCWDVHPETIGRKLFAARLRWKGLAREVPASLAALEAQLTEGGRA
jgi:uncharacterized protein YndB with AHSA1/START domain